MRLIKDPDSDKRELKCSEQKIRTSEQLALEEEKIRLKIATWRELAPEGAKGYMLNPEYRKALRELEIEPESQLNLFDKGTVKK